MLKQEKVSINNSVEKSEAEGEEEDEEEEEDRLVFQEIILRGDKKSIFKATKSQESDSFILDELLKGYEGRAKPASPLAPDPSPIHYPNMTLDNSDETFLPLSSRQSSARSLLREHCSSRLGKCNCDPITVSVKDRSGKTAAHYCAENQNVNCIGQILSSDPELVTLKDEEGYTPLHLAVISGNKIIVKYLISKGADINAVDDERHSSVHWATVCGELECLEILINDGALTATPDIHGAYPLHYAAQICGKTSDSGADIIMGLAVLKRLIKYGVDVSVRDRDGRQPLMWAASSGSSDAILCLVNAGASVKQTDKDGLTPLHCAASRGHRDSVETLVGLCGADITVKDNNGCTPLFYSVTLGRIECTRLLLDYGANPNAQDKKGRSPAHCGASKGQLETLKLLAKYKGNMWKRNIRGDLPFHDAIHSSRKDLIRWFLSGKPEAIDWTNNDGKSALHIAALNNNVELCKILIDHRANVNEIMRNEKGDLLTPLDSALLRGNRGCAKYIQLHGGVPASKLTNKIALQKALLEAFNPNKKDVSETIEIHSQSFENKEEEPELELGTHVFSQMNESFIGHDETLIDNDHDKYSLNETKTLYIENNSDLSQRTLPDLPSIDASELVNNDSTVDIDSESTIDSLSKDVPGTESPITVLQIPPKETHIITPEMNPISTQTEDISENIAKETQTSFSDEHSSSESSCKSDPANENDFEDISKSSSFEKDKDVLTETATEPETANQPESQKEINESGEGKENEEGLFTSEKRIYEEESLSLKNFEISDKEELSVHQEYEVELGVPDEISDDSALQSSSMQNPTTMEDSGIGAERSQDEDDSNADQKSQLAKVSSQCSRGMLLKTMLEDYDDDSNHSEYYSEDEKQDDRSRVRSSSSPTLLEEIRPSTVCGGNGSEDTTGRKKSSFHLYRRPVRENYRYQNKLRSYQLKPRRSSAISMTQAVQMSLRKYKMERRIFQELLELKRLQIRAGRANEQVLVKRLSDNYTKSIQDLIGLKKHDGPYTFKDFEKYLYDQLRRMQESHNKLIPKVCKTRDDLERLSLALRRHGVDCSSFRYLFENCNRKGEDHPADCTHLSHRCHHATHAYSGIPCLRKIKQKSLILPKINDGHNHSLLATTRIRKYDPKEPLTLELTHGSQKQSVKLPTENLEKSTKYYVTLTVDPKRNTT